MNQQRTGVSRRSFLAGSLGLFSGTFVFGCSDPGAAPPSPDAALPDAALPDAALPDAALPDAAPRDVFVDAAPQVPDVAPRDVFFDAAEASVDAGDAASVCDTLTGATREAVARLLPDPTLPLDMLFGEGLDGRLYTDLSTLDERTLALPTERFYVRTRASTLLDSERPWRVRATGLIAAPRELTIEMLRARAVDQGEVLLECSGNGSGGAFGLLGAARWEGVALRTLVAEQMPTAAATRVLVSGFDEYPQASARSTPGASWVFTLNDLAETGAFLATSMNGAPLTRDHGAPLRLVVPGWYGCTCIKWVDVISLVDDSVASTAHMIEFAERTQQRGTPALARDFLPAEIDLAAMPVRVERWRRDGAALYRVVGIYWGGRDDAPLELRLNPTLPWEPVRVCRRRSSARTWGVWEHVIRLPMRGRYVMQLRTPDRSVRTRRLDAGFYARTLEVTET